jgi:thiol-disulfide isomerase/thioredoxin
VEDLDGKPRTISPVPGKVTLISLVTNVCARWRAQCDRPLPALEAFYKEFGNKGVAVFAIAEEGRELFTDSLDGETFTVPIFIDPANPFLAIFDEPRRHESFLFDGGGKLVLRAIGIRTQDQLSEMVKKVGVK